ncbi:MAG: hypothetical protein ABIY90_02650 [Puia sp.]
MKRIYEVLLISAGFLIICFVYRGQHRATINPGWDASYYYSITEQIQKGTTPVAGELPFIKRIATPYLIARMSNMTGMSLLDSALGINLLGTFVTTLLLLCWLGIFFKESWIRILLCFLFMMAWHVPLRFSFYNPMTTDAWGAAWMMAGLLILQLVRKFYANRRTRAWIAYLLVYSLIIGVAALFRESNAILSVLPFFVVYPLGELNIVSATPPLTRGINILSKTVRTFFNWKTALLLIPVLFVLGAAMFIKKFIVVTDPENYSYIWTAISWLYLKTLPEFVLGILIAYGPLILLVPFFYGKYKSLLRERQELWVLLIVSLLLGLIGGSDTERILFMTGFPVVLILIGISIRQVFYSTQRWWFYLLLVLQSISFRFFWSLPDYPGVNPHAPIPFFGIAGSHFKYLNLYSRFSNYYLNCILLLQFLLLFLATWYVLRNKTVLRKNRSLL